LLGFAGFAALFHALIVLSFPAIGGMRAVQSVVQTLPDGLRNLLRIAPNLQAGFTLREYLAFSWFHPLFLGLGAAFVVQRATDAIATEIETGGVYLTLSRPVPRWAYLMGKAIEMLIGAGLVCLAGWAGLAITAPGLPEAVPLGGYLLAAFTAWLLFGALGGGALVISAMCSRESISAGIGAAWTLVALFLDVIPGVAASPLGQLNPWHHYYPQEIVTTGSIQFGSGLALSGWIVGSIVVATLIFRNRDLV
jgi:ABC-type transport system involved in multi-copper enzyme maturation permease subunit